MTGPISPDSPWGYVQPQQERALLALKAMHEERWSDAEKHIAAIPESPPSEYAWKMYLAGRLAGERHDFAFAEAGFLKAASASMVSGLCDKSLLAADAMRLGAAAMEKLGCIYRRQERLDEAYRTHRAAYRLRQEHGSFDERWETATSLAVDAALARRDNEAERWCRVAIDLAARASEQPDVKHAQAWNRLAVVSTSLGRHEKAVEAARTARDCWRKHDITALAAARADVELAGALIKYAESVYSSDAAKVRQLLNEAIECLARGADELPPFGNEAAADVRRCIEQTDFARRLLASL